MHIKFPLKYKADLKIVGVALLYYLFARLGYFWCSDEYSVLAGNFVASGIYLGRNDDAIYRQIFLGTIAGLASAEV